MKALRFLLGVFTFFFTLGLVLALIGSYWSWHEFTKPVVSSDKLYEVTSGTGLNSLAANLGGEAVLDPGARPQVLWIYGRLIEPDQTLKAGEYEFKTGMSLKDILAKIRAGDTYKRFVTIPEGLTSYEITEILKGVADLGGEITQIPDEGSLLPETYDYRRGEERQDVIKRMQGAMKAALEEACKTHTCDSGGIFKSSRDVLILASIIEKETGKPEERRTVAGVFVNRLRQNMALQTDPSVIYALTLGKHEREGQGPLGRRLLKKDLEFDSPYNTYLYPGLPPGPIANPGKASIAAALDPEVHEYLYFVADGTGGHLFARTLDEHNRNVANWRKIRDQATE